MYRPLPWPQRGDLRLLHESQTAIFFVLLALACIFAFYPRFIAADTQLTALVLVAVAYILSNRLVLISRHGVFLAILALIAFAVAAVRVQEPYLLLRYGVQLLSLVLFYEATRRLRASTILYVSLLTLMVFFLVGASQTLLSLAEHDTLIWGRYMPGRGGVPSLTPESSYYGICSALLAIAAARCTRRSGTIIFAVSVAAGNVMLSGSMLAVLVLAGLLLLEYRLAILKVAAVALLPALILVFSFGAALPGLARFTTVFALQNSGGVLSDYSINLRLGHIFFTLVHTFRKNVLLEGSADFESEYNAWSGSSAYFFPTGSDYILPTLGQFFFYSGLFGVALVLAFLWGFVGGGRKASSTLLIGGVALFLQPVQLSTPFIYLYLASSKHCAR